MEGGDEVMDERPVLLEEGSVAAFSSDALRTSEVEVYAVAVWCNMFRRREEVGGGV